MSESTIQQVLSAARLLFQAGDVLEVRVPKAKRFKTIAGYFNDVQLMAEAVAALDREGFTAVYWTLNPVHPDLLARGVNKVLRYLGEGDTTKDDHVLRRRLMLIDTDPERLSGISSTDEEHEAALAKARAIREALLALGWPEPLYADSGNGGHLVYRIEVLNDREHAELLSGCLQALAARFDDPEGAKPRIRVDKTVFNASRISKIYGTMVRKGDNTAERPHRVSRILEVPALLTPVPVELLRALGAQAPEEKKKNAPKAQPHRSSRAVKSDFDLRQFLDKYGVRYREPVPYDGGLKYTLYECPFDPSHKAKDAAVFDRPDGYGFHCFHNGCAGRDWKEFRSLFEPDAYSRRPAGGHSHTPHPADSEIPPYSQPLDDFPEDYDEGESVTQDEVLAMVLDAIERGDQDGVNLLAPEIAKLNATHALRIKSKMVEKFGRKFRAKDFEAAIRDERRRAIAGLPPEDTGLPIIIVNNRPMRDVVADSLAALRAANDPPFLFVRTGEMVFVETDERERPSIRSVEKAHLRGRLDRAANYIRRGSEADIAVPPPLEIVEDILALPSAQWGAPPLECVVEVPTLRPDGTVLASRGYDPISRMLYAPAAGFQMEPIPEVIDGAEVEAAVIFIDEAIYDFPFAEKDPGSDVEYKQAGNPNRANMFGLLLTPIVRPAIAGVVPLALIDAPQAGTGKSLLVDLFSIVTTGRAAAMMPFPRQEEEMQKLIGSTLLAGTALVCFDNIEGILQSPNLALALTAKDYQARILGVSENMIASNRATWVATGNNIRPSGDMPRRCYHIRLDAKKSRPYQGRKFRHENLLDWAREMRPQLLRSLLIIARAWYQRKEKPPVLDLWGSFEDWHRTVGGILRSARVDGFLGNLQSFLGEADDNALQWEGFLSEIEAFYGYEWFTAGKVVAEIRAATPVTPAPFTLPDSLGDVDRRKEGSLERALGKSFAKRLGTRYGERELYLDRAIETHTKQAKWRVLMPETEAAAKSAALRKSGEATTTKF
jgi:hypothetical protein